MKKIWSIAFIGAMLAGGVLTACNKTVSDDKGDDSTTIIGGDEVKETYKLDFTTLTDSSTVENAFTADWLTLGTYENIYASAGTGGCHASEYGLVKMGTSKNNGVINLTTTENFTQCKVVCHDFYALSDTYPTNSNKLDINGIEKLSPYNAEGTGEELVWTFDANNSFTFTSSKRVYLWSIEFIKQYTKVLDKFKNFFYIICEIRIDVSQVNTYQ